MEKFSDKINEAKEYSSAEEFLLHKKCTLENGYWNCPGNLSIPERLQHLFLKNGKLIMKFGIIQGKFTFRGNQVDRDNTNPNIITSLDGMPLEVRKNFSVAYQKGIESAIGCPQKVADNVEFRGCRLTSLEGLPPSCDRLILIGNQFRDLTGLTCSPRAQLDVSGGRLTSLKGLAMKITCEALHASNNRISNLEGIHLIETENYSLDSNALTTLKGAPLKCKWFTASDNTKLKSFLYHPEIEGNFESYRWRQRDKKHLMTDIEIMWFSESNLGMKELQNETLYYTSLLNFVLSSEDLAKGLNTIDWPEGLVGDNLKASAKGLGKFNI